MNQITLSQIKVSALIVLCFSFLQLSSCRPCPQDDPACNPEQTFSPRPTSACSPSGAACAPHIDSFQGPLLNDVLADPSILKDGDTYYAYATQHSKTNTNVPFAVSKNGLRGAWQAGDGDAMPRTGPGLGAWTVNPHGDSGLWNPDVSKLNSTHYIIYYSAKSATAHGHERCIGVGYSTSPTGPFHPRDKPWYCPPSAGAIGVDAVIDHSKSPPERYVLFKNGSFEGTPGHLSHIALWQVSADDGFSKIGDSVPLTQSLPNEIGEESPALARMPDRRWLLLHTEGIWTTNYTIVYAVSEGSDVKGPYHDYHYERVLLKDGDSSGESRVFQPGGPDFVGGSHGMEFIFAAKKEEGAEARYLYAGSMGYVPAKNGDLRTRHAGPDEW